MLNLIEKIKLKKIIEEAIEADINKNFKTRCKHKKHFFIQYGIRKSCGEFYIKVVKSRNKKWIHVDLIEVNLSTGDFIFIHSEHFRKLKKKHQIRLNKLAIAFINRIKNQNKIKEKK